MFTEFHRIPPSVFESRPVRFVYRYILILYAAVTPAHHSGPDCKSNGVVMKNLIIAFSLSFCITSFAAGPNDGVYSMTSVDIVPGESLFASLHQTDDVVVIIVLSLESDGEASWDAAQGTRTGDSVELVFLIEGDGLRLLLEFNGTLNATGTITGCAASPDNLCDPVIWTVFDLVKYF